MASPLYRQVPNVKPAACVGCAARYSEILCARLSALDRRNCGWTFVWIPVTPKGLADYVALKLEDGND